MSAAQKEVKMKLICKALVIVSVLFGSSMRTSFSQTTVQSTTAQIEVAINETRSGRTSLARFEAGDRLANLTKKLKAQQVTETLVSDISSLLDSPDDAVRYWAAMALGNIGVPAKSAAPKMIAMLPYADCLNGTITSASGIRYALFKMGIKQPPGPANCKAVTSKH